MLSYIHQLKNAKPAKPAKHDDMKSEASSGRSSDIYGLEQAARDAKEGAIVYLPPAPTTKKKKQSPQAAIDEFWGKFNSKTPGRG